MYLFLVSRVDVLSSSKTKREKLNFTPEFGGWFMCFANTNSLKRVLQILLEFPASGNWIAHFHQVKDKELQYLMSEKMLT